MEPLSRAPKGGHGAITLDPGAWGLGRRLEIVGGPYARCPEGVFGVCLLERPPSGMAVDVWLPIRDFSVPADRRQVERALLAALGAAFAGRMVYVGCQGGFGRTGLFLALLAKVTGVAQPVAFVRAAYLPQAVETSEQARYVDRFGDRWRWRLLGLALRHPFGRV